MGVDEAGRDDPAGGVDDGGADGIGVLAQVAADGGDGGAGHQHVAAAEVAELRVHGDDGAAGEQGGHDGKLLSADG